jgi:hypothetical protein
MKKLLALLVTTLALTVSAAETQKVCVDKLGKDGKVVVGKDGKPQQECKEMKVHKKLEGTKVPEKK